MSYLLKHPEIIKLSRRRSCSFIFAPGLKGLISRSGAHALSEECSRARHRMNKPEANFDTQDGDLKRGKTTPEIYMSNEVRTRASCRMLVFPGGALDEHDHSLEWASMTNISRHKPMTHPRE